MKIFSWNVNGIRSSWGKGLKKFIEENDPDILCLQEIKCKPDQFNELDNSGLFLNWNSAEKPGYSGTLTISKQKPSLIDHGIKGMPDPEGRVLRTDFDEFTLLNCYFPNSQRDHARLGYKLEFCSEFLGFVQALQKKKPVIVCGDLNIAHKEIDLKNPKQNVKNAGFLPEERAAFDKMLENDLVDAFRIFTKEGEHFTWWSSRPGVRAKNIGWRLDYFLVSASAEKKVKSCEIYPKVMGSDHCPVGLTWNQNVANR